MNTPKTLTRVDQLSALSEIERRRLKAVTEHYPMRIPEEYLKLIDWNDAQDPIRRLVVPQAGELADWGQLDASNEAANTPQRGVQHKYPDTALLLCNEVCAGYCRYCFRKRLFMAGNDEVSLDVTPGLRYIAAHPEISNVLLTGGDPLVLSARRLREILEGLWAIPHVRVVRIGSKTPAFNPTRLLEDGALLEVLGSTPPGRRLYLMTHFDHPRELTEAALSLLDRLMRLGVVLANQCPLVRGVNDRSDVLGELFQRLAWAGCPPYYLFQMRPTAGNAPFTLPLVQGWEVFQQALSADSGLARRARFVMSHATGKVEVAGVDEHHLYLRYHRPQDREQAARLLRYRRDDEVTWLDELIPSPRMIWRENRPQPNLGGYPDKTCGARGRWAATGDGCAQFQG